MVAAARMTGPSDLALSEQVAVVTGAARGIGFATAERLAAAGVRVAVVDIDGSGAAAAAARLATPEARSFVADVADEEDVRRAFGQIIDEYGRVDILVNNAGIYPHTPYEEVTFSHWQHVVHVNLDSVYLCCNAVLPTMKSQGYGRIVSVSSGAWLIGVPTLAPYVAAKAGVVALTRVLSKMYGPEGITVNAIYPGLIETDNSLAQAPDAFDELVAAQDVRRRGKPTDIAGCVMYLVRPDTEFLTGQTINVDGGLTYT
jgi:NAD(P)-dependent dehydrogenase (short-subunit alcohol dehydrogenase family)